MTPAPLSPEARVELVEKAKAATPGPWLITARAEPAMILGGPSERYVANVQVHQTGGGMLAELMQRERHANAAFIAAANPSTILSYEATVQALTVERDAALERVKALEAGASREEVLKAVQAVMLNLRIASNYDRDGDEEVAGAMVTNEVDRLTALFRPTSGGGTP